MNRSSSRRNSARSSHSLSDSSGILGAAFEAARERAGAQVGEIVEQVKHEGQAFVAGRRELLAEQLTNVSSAIRRAADKLHDTDSEFIAAHVDRAADAIDDVGRYIEEKDLPDVIEDASVIARRRPVLFIGGMFLAGIAASRFLKAAAAAQSGRRGR